MFKHQELKIHSLEVGDDPKFHNNTLSRAISEITKTSKLAEINLADLDRDNTETLDLVALLGPLEEDSGLKHLNLGQLYDPERVEQLLSSISKLRGLKEITFGLSGDADSEEAVQAMIQSFKKNMSLEQVNFDSYFIGDDHRAANQRFCDRNEYTHRWIADPSAVPISSWPRLFESAIGLEYQRDVSFRSLIALSKRAGQHGTLKRSRES
jgi:hypothetical protein